MEKRKVGVEVATRSKKNQKVDKIKDLTPLVLMGTWIRLRIEFRKKW